VAVTQYKITTIRVKFGRLAEFFDAFQDVVLPLVERSGRQRLLASYHTVTGPSIFEVIHIWELEDANAHVRGLLDPSNPDFLAVCERLQDLVEGEGSNLLLKTPYSP
jgi:hypothetical protein